MAKQQAGQLAINRALSAFIKLMRASNTVSARLTRHLVPDKLTVSQLGVLEALLHLGPLHQHEIGKKLLKSGGNITVVIDHLEQRGLVRRLRDSKDRRCITVSLSATGRRLIKRVFKCHAQHIAEQFAVLTAAEQKELARLCKKLGMGGINGN